ncbi:MAG: hypothetical protein ACI9LO_001876 [Planctomycetota bacterium]|jgi:hypothetical protein
MNAAEISRVLVFMALSLQMSTLQASDFNLYSQGEAFQLNSDSLLYRETHCEALNGKSQEVIYKNSRDELIAFKTLDYSTGNLSPSFLQYNYGRDQSVEVLVKESSVSMVVKNTALSKIESSNDAKIDQRIPVVVDAGFDRYIKQNWDALVSGEQKQFQFPLASRSSLIELRVGSASCNYQSETDQCFKLEMANWLYRMLVDPILLGYDADQKRLMRYRGLSNIEDKNGDGLIVDIHYRYSDFPAQVCEQSGHRLTL